MRNSFVLTIATLLITSPSLGWQRTSDQRTKTPDEVIKEHKEWGVSLGLGLNVLEGNSDSRAVRGQSTLFKTSEDFVYYADLKANYAENGGEVIQNKGRLVLRADLLTQKKLRWFVFTTHGYSELTKLDYRGTLGAGPWYEYGGKDWSHALSLAPTYFYENFRGFSDEKNVRLSLRSLYQRQWTSTAKVGYDLFYMPKIDEYEDFQIYVSPYLELDVYKTLVRLRLSVDLEHDSRPKAGVRPNDIAYFTSVIVSLGE